MLFIVCAGCGKKDNNKSTNGSTEAQDIKQDIQIDNVQVDSETGMPSDQTVDEDGFTVTDDYVKTFGITVNVRVEPNTDSYI